MSNDTLSRPWLSQWGGWVIILTPSRRVEFLLRSIGAQIEKSPKVQLPIKQVFFRTRRGRSYRAIFLIVGDEVRILRVRGPGQDSIDSDEFI